MKMRKFGALIIGVLVAALGEAKAQGPWRVTVTPTLNPLPIPFCAAVHLDLLDPATGEVPRNPQGYRITMADFDMSVSTPDGRSAAGQRTSASTWSACACQGAAAGTVATVTAAYPDKRSLWRREFRAWLFRARRRSAWDR